MKSPRKNGNPSSTFYWKDWETDEGLRVCSLAAQGLWMRLLCVAAKAEPYGYVLINGCEVGVTDAARLCGVSETEAATLLDELDRKGVFSRDRKGRIFCRRMVKEAATREKNRKNGKKGGNPRLSTSDGKDTEKQDPVNPPDNPRDKPPYPLPIPLDTSYPIKDGGGVVAREADRAPTDVGDLIAAVLHALGFDRCAAIPKYWIAPDAHLIVSRWRSDLGLTDGEIIHVAAANHAQHGSPANGPMILNKPMRDFAAAKIAPPLQPTQAPGRQPAAEAPQPRRPLYTIDPDRFHDDGSIRA